jgi:hypothetical protein
MDFKFELRKHQRSKIPKEDILLELERVAKIYKYVDFKQDDFDKHSSISSYTVYREFGSWQAAINALFDHLKAKGIDFKLTTRRSSYTDRELFDEMERIWLKLGHQPSKNEWISIDYKISYDTYPRHFGSWQSACLKFIELKSGQTVTMEPLEISKEGKKFVGETAENRNGSQKGFNTRTISLSLRIKILSRDKFKCVFCGKSPATDIGTKLHIDHIIPFSKGGKSILENLQTLCEECNLGKSNQEINSVNISKDV